MDLCNPTRTVHPRGVLEQQTFNARGKSRIIYRFPARLHDVGLHEGTTLLDRTERTLWARSAQKLVNKPSDARKSRNKLKAPPSALRQTYPPARMHTQHTHTPHTSHAHTRTRTHTHTPHTRTHTLTHTHTHTHTAEKDMQTGNRLEPTARLKRSSFFRSYLATPNAKRASYSSSSSSSASASISFFCASSKPGCHCHCHCCYCYCSAIVGAS